MKGNRKKVYTRENSSHQYSFILVNVTDKQYYPEHTKLHCLYDGFKIGDNPVGCPLEFYPAGTKVRKSNSKNGDVEILSKSCYVCEGIFCSLNCALSYAKSMKHENPMLYGQAEQFLQQMFFESHSKSSIGLTPANKKVIKEYGGEITVEQFRASLDTFTTYEHRGRLFPCVEKFQVVAPLFSQKYSLTTTSLST